MEAAQGESRAVGGDEQVAPLEVRGQGRNEMELDGPLAEAGGDGAGPALLWLLGIRLARDLPGQAAGASAVTGVGMTGVAVSAARPVDLGCGGRAARLQNVVEGGLGIVLAALPLDDLEGVGRADVQAGPQPVAIDLADKDGLVLGVEGQGALGAGRRAEAAAVALIAIDLDDFPFAILISCDIASGS